MNNTSLPVSGDGGDEGLAVEEFTEYKAAVSLWTYIPPILIIVGTIGNILTIVVLSRSPMRHSTTSLYLRVLAVVDILVLVTGLLRQWLLYLIDKDIRWMTEIGCKIHVWILYFSVHSSAWLLVAVTLERVLSVMFPHMVKMKCTRKTAYAIISTIILFFLLLNAHYLYGIGDYVIKDGNETRIIPCDGITDDYYNFETKVWPWIDFCVYSFAPSTILCISNFLIIRKVFISDRKAVDSRGYSGDSEGRKSKTSAMTLTLVVVSATYVVCTTPFCIYAIYTNIHKKNLSNHTRAMRSLGYAAVNLLQYTNNAINFILYCVTGTRFRQELMGLVCKKTLATRPTMYTTSTTRSTTLKTSTSETLTQ